MNLVTLQRDIYQQIIGYGGRVHAIRLKTILCLSYVVGVSVSMYLLCDQIYTKPGSLTIPIPAQSSQLTKIVYSPITTELDWRSNELKRLGDLVYRRLDYIQNPVNCNRRKKVFCSYTKTIKVGFGSLMHDGIICLLVAYVTQRTLVLESRGMPYSKRGMEALFEPLSTNCTSIKGQNVTSRRSLHNVTNDEVISLPRHTDLIQRPDYFPSAVPADLARNLSRVHLNPSGWWIGLLLSYILRYNNSLRKFIEQRIVESGFQHPIVGVQVRRTDKKSEARYHDLGEYMKHVEEWFVVYEKEHGPVPRKVFIASDDTNVFKEVVRRFPNFIFISNTDTSKFAKNYKTRYSEMSLRGVILDVEMLSRCDFFVGTFSSSVARLVYELMNVRYWDAPNRVKSLDVDYLFNINFIRNSERIRRIFSNNKRARLFANISDRGVMIVNIDEAKRPVQMPEYPMVPVY